MYIVYLRRIVYLLLLPKGPSELQTMYYSINAQAEEGVARGRTQLPHYCVYRRFAQCALLRNVASIAGNLKQGKLLIFLCVTMSSLSPLSHYHIFSGVVMYIHVTVCVP